MNSILKQVVVQDPIYQTASDFWTLLQLLCKSGEWLLWIQERWNIESSQQTYITIKTVEFIENIEFKWFAFYLHLCLLSLIASISIYYSRPPAGHAYMSTHADLS